MLADFKPMSQAKLVEISLVALRLKSSALRFKGTTSQKIVECSILVAAGYLATDFVEHLVANNVFSLVIVVIFCAAA